jgi:serine/threonine-protein kinase
MADRARLAPSADHEDAKATRAVTQDASWSRIKALFQAVIDRDPADRDAVLDDACGGDAALKQRVESLLSAHAAAGGFAERPAIEVLDALPGGAGAYQLQSLLGAGGMGEVYRARDMTLGRDVAIKILPPIFVADPDRLLRFDREARVLASLSHPNICAIHGIADINGTPGLVLELVDGRTLAELIAAAATRRRRLGISETLAIARDVARALEAAHEKGIIHRDLKPANIKITADGIVKVLDFGLAKAGAADSAVGADPNAATSGAASVHSHGLAGTAAYMSPEQARGEPLDKRTDIWSFGCVLYEMLTGRPAAKGTTVSDTIAAVLDGEPDWTALPPTTPPIIGRLLRRCLDKDAKRRLKDIGDARFDIEEALSAGDANARQSAVVPNTTSRRLSRLLIATLAGGAVLAFLWSRPAARVPPAELRRVSAELGTDASLVTYQYGQGPAVILSPNGEMLAFVAQRSGGEARRIYVRRLDELQAAPLAGTDGALNPFFSPDSQWIAFFADGTLKKIPASGGGAITLCPVLNNRGGAWSEDGRIVFSPDREAAPLWQISSSGGKPEPLIALGDGETTQRWPQMLRGGGAVLFTGNKGPDGFADANVIVQTLPNGPRKVLIRGAYYGRYLPSGHLLYVHDATLFAAPFDLARLEVTGPAAPVLRDFAVNMPVGTAEIVITDAGTVAYLSSSQYLDTLSAPLDWVNRDGTSTPMRTTPARWMRPRFAPDGRRLAFDLFDGAQYDLWTYDWSRDVLSRLTFEWAMGPVWTPDGRRIAFTSLRGGKQRNLYWQQVDGTGEAQRLTHSDRRQLAGSWDPSGRTLAFTEYDPQTAAPTIMLLRLEGDNASGWKPAQPTAFMNDADDPMLSPDGRWMAYVAKEPGRDKHEVYVRPFPGSGGRWQISIGGGDDPAWSLTRPELIYATPDRRLMTVPYSVTRESFHADKPRRIPNSRFVTRPVDRSFDLHPDGNRMVLFKASEAPTHDHVILIFNFLDTLRAIAPPGRSIQD